MGRIADSEVFALPHEGGFLLYAPLAGRVVHANAGCVAQIQRYLKSGDSSEVDADVVSRLGGLEWLEASPPPVPAGPDAPYAPTRVTLFLSNRCNLACTYCYADAGSHQPCRLAPEVMRAAVDLAATNAAAAERPMAVGFHGGGEPTHAWAILNAAIDHARRRADQQGLELGLGLATNGVMSRARQEAVATTFPSVTLSLDGPAEIQDRQRPRCGGKPSHAAVMAFVEALHRHDTHFVVRCTVTHQTVDSLPDLVDFFVDRIGCRLVHFEPAFAAGRAHSDQQQLPSPARFARAFAAATDRAAQRGIRVRYSAARLYGAFNSFCGCSQDPLNITPDGDVTACFEVCDRANPKADTFIFGSYDRSTNGFVIDRRRLAFLRTFTVHHRPECRQCFARWNCSGDCPAKWSSGGPDSERCEMHRTITRELLVRTLDPKRCAAV